MPINGSAKEELATVDVVGVRILCSCSAALWRNLILASGE